MKSLFRLLQLLFLSWTVLAHTEPDDASTCSSASTAKGGDDIVSYILIGVSGTLQDGFPLRDRLDYHHPGDDNDISSSTTKAILVGKALVRGYKAYLDIKDEGWREYQPDLLVDDDSIIPNLNAVVIPSGCWEHANIYWVYLVDARQVMSILLHEPRFLSITPDTGLVDLTADETSCAITTLARHLAATRPQLPSSKINQEQVAIPLVTGVWHHESFVESPILYTKSDGTQVTSFDESLAIWANITKTEEDDSIPQSSDPCTISSTSAPTPLKSAAYWKRVKNAIRNVSSTRDNNDGDDNNNNNKHSFGGHKHYNCQKRARFGVTSNTHRINYPLSSDDFDGILVSKG